MNCKSAKEVLYFVIWMIFGAIASETLAGIIYFVEQCSASGWTVPLSADSCVLVIAMIGVFIWSFLIFWRMEDA